MRKTFGHFNKDGSEFVVERPDTPRDWFNYFWNERYVALFSQSAAGESLVQDSKGRRIDVVFKRMAFVRDMKSGAFHSLNALPVDEPRESYRCVHGLGFSEILQEKDGLETSFRCFVPREGACEVWTLKLRNKRRTARTLKAFFFIDTLFGGAFRAQTYYGGKGRFDKEANAVFLKSRQDFDGACEAELFFAVDREASGFDSSAEAFVGHGTWQRPDAVARGRCSGSSSEMEKSCCALETSFVLKPGAEIEINAIAGAEKAGSGELAKLRSRFFAPGAAEAELESVKSATKELLGGSCIASPDKTLDKFFNKFLKRQVSLGVQWARVRHNGYRDQMQDICAFAAINAKEAERQLHRLLSWQYASGYAPRTWLDGKILDRNFSDNHVWIPFAVHQLVMETGDLSLLERQAPFNDGSSASVYEHVKRAVDFSWNDRALFGLVKMRGGDWNDCLERVGARGEGVSVWLSMAWRLANSQFEELARLSGREADAATAKARGEEMKKLVNLHAWDGDWYLRAFNDDGEPLGSRSNPEGTLFLLPQAWSVVSGVAEGGRGEKAMDSVARLLETELGTVKLLNPYSKWDPKIGSSSLKTPGTHENGGVYLHACVFKLAADCLLKRNEAVSLALRKMLPFAPSRVRKPCEPYVFCNSYFAQKGSWRYGDAGQSWGTGTAGWFHTVALEGVFGLKPAFEGLRVSPCLPPEWKSAVATRFFRGTEYRVRVEQLDGCHELASIEVDGAPFDGETLPAAPGGKVDVLVKMRD